MCLISISSSNGGSAKYIVYSSTGGSEGVLSFTAGSVMIKGGSMLLTGDIWTYVF